MIRPSKPILGVGIAVVLTATPLLRVDAAPCVAISAGAETTSSPGSVQNVGQAVIGRAGSATEQMWAGILPCLRAGDLVPQPPQLIGAVSRKTHGGSGDFDIDLLGPNAVECRNGGPTRILAFFDAPIQGTGGLDPSDVSVSGSAVVNGLAIIGGNVLAIDLSGADNADVLEIVFNGIEGPTGLAVTDALCLEVLAGDATRDSSVNVFDLFSVRNHLGVVLGPANFTNDLTVDGSVNVFDLFAARNNLPLFVPGGCP